MLSLLQYQTYLQQTTCSIFTGRYLDRISDVLLIKHLLRHNMQPLFTITYSYISGYLNQNTPNVLWRQSTLYQAIDEAKHNIWNMFNCSVANAFCTKCVIFKWDRLCAVFGVLLAGHLKTTDQQSGLYHVKRKKNAVSGKEYDSPSPPATNVIWSQRLVTGFCNWY